MELIERDDRKKNEIIAITVTRTGRYNTTTNIYINIYIHSL